MQDEEGNALKTYEAGSARKLCNIIAKDIGLGSISNAMYVGREAQKLEDHVAIRRKIAEEYNKRLEERNQSGG